MIPKLSKDNSAYGSAGTKHNLGKPALSIFPRSAAIEAAKTFMDGAEKYSLHNYKQGLSAHEMADALLRHLYAWLDGEKIVPDSKHGAHHLGAVIANAAMIIECERLGTLVDDRYKGKSEAEPTKAEIKEPKVESKINWPESI